MSQKQVYSSTSLSFLFRLKQFFDHLLIIIIWCWCKDSLHLATFCALFVLMSSSHLSKSMIHYQMLILTSYIIISSKSMSSSSLNPLRSSSFHPAILSISSSTILSASPSNIVMICLFCSFAISWDHSPCTLSSSTPNQDASYTSIQLHALNHSTSVISSLIPTLHHYHSLPFNTVAVFNL